MGPSPCPINFRRGRSRSILDDLLIVSFTGLDPDTAIQRVRVTGESNARCIAKQHLLHNDAKALSHFLVFFNGTPVVGAPNLPDCLQQLFKIAHMLNAGKHSCI